jgi:hypothetical protein
LAVGAVLVLGIGAFVGSRFAASRWTRTPYPPQSKTARTRAAEGLATAYLRSLFRLTVVLVQKYAVVVLVIGGLSGWASQFEGLSERLGLFGVLAAATVGALLVKPTGGEVPVLLASPRWARAPGSWGRCSSPSRR